MKSDKICNIDIEKEESWKSNVFFTFDVDWASDEVFNETLDLLDSYNASATFFCTHETKVLERLRAGDRYEIGVHPNFNFLLEGNFRYGSNYKEVLKYYKAIVPESVSVRSHSLTQQSKDNHKNTQLKTIFKYLQEHVATASMVSEATGIPQKNITRYKRDLEKVGRLWEVEKKLCKKTGFKAWYITSNQQHKPKHLLNQLNLF